MTTAVESQNFISLVILLEDFVKRGSTRFGDVQKDDCLRRHCHLTRQTLQDAIGHEQLSVRSGLCYLFSVRYLVKAKLKLDKSKSLLRSIAGGTLGKGSIA